MSIPNSDFVRILKDVNTGQFKPVYVLSGEESYYLDKIAEAIERKGVDESQKDFNQVVMYGQDANAVKIMEACNQYPMMAERVVVIVKEAHQVRLDDLEGYFEKPQPTTVLVLVHPKKLDGRKGYTKKLKKNDQCVLLETKKHYDNELPAFVEYRLREMAFSADLRSLAILSEYLGNDLHRIDNELKKLSQSLPPSTTLTPEIIEEYVGISKIYNPFEFANALMARDFPKAMTIVKGFEANPKAHPLVATIAILYGYFAKLLQVHAHKITDSRKAASVLGVNPFFAQDYVNAAKKYTFAEGLKIMALLRKYDRIAKGVGGNAKPNTLTELVCSIIQK
jgi:DNA polymerase III subunit delta